MAFYELVFIIRQDVSLSEVDNITNELTSLITQDYKGSVIKQEYWDLRNLAYKIKNNKKGHYVFLGISLDNEGLIEVRKKIKFKEEIIRENIVKVKSIDPEPSAILKVPTSQPETVNISSK